MPSAARSPIWLLGLNLLLLAACAVAIGLVQLRDHDPSAVDALVHRYATALGAQDLSAAMAEIAPQDRDAWRGFVSDRLGDQYAIHAVSVRSQPLLDHLLHGGDSRPTEATVVMDVNKDFPDLFYQASTRAPVVLRDGRWYLSQPPLSADDLPQPRY